MDLGTALLCLVIAVSDGDTVKVRCEARFEEPALTLTVRLAEIDAPEKGQAFGTRSKANLAALCFGRPAAVRRQKKDRYGRTVGRVACGDLDASAEQVRAGMAWAFTQYLTDPAVKQLEVEARTARRGLWSDDTPTPPWAWRKVQRGRKGAGLP